MRSPKAGNREANEAVAARRERERSRYAWRTWVLGVGLPVGLTMSIATVYTLRGRVMHSLLQAAISVAFSTLVAMGLSYVAGLYFWSREEH
jgi:hypothetical protein